ncbi:hypothetical protein P872_19650 [Rhodonellum psychrophilum GCM71 = DSM 17998]|uniref:Uncharacterized protein n=1 Tax=Rhodonellum psychrophilum GCM71 = DSM 17998 TaxID=1123057 RepID=U5BVX8_9BACT|nr:hypothetical protein P872_19650 [Rhodonellum psychrophilum GCM71 = DSM 17998]
MANMTLEKEMIIGLGEDFLVFENHSKTRKSITFASE